LNQRTEAMTVAERAVTIMPNNPVAWARKGQVQRRLGHHADALESYLKALELDDAYAWAWNGKGLALAGLKRWDEAIEAYEMAVQNNANDLWFWNNYGEALMAVGDYASAVTSYERAAAIDPRHEITQSRLKQARDLLNGES
ncbi:MAG: tetratricopeptide repeat protein, partial [Anaerolineae bacterium]|nr:tetratricopeptide repeat protein [Anaerolineae bacterium]